MSYYGGRNGSGRSVPVYTDGSCHRNGRQGASGGIGVYWGENDSRNVSEPYHGRQTNNSAEIRAVERAVQQAGQSGIRDITVHTDSEFTINGATKWKDNWERNGWKTSSGQPVKNKEDFQALDRAIRDTGVNVSYEHVRGHQGNRGNSQADRLAHQGAHRRY